MEFYSANSARVFCFACSWNELSRRLDGRPPIDQLAGAALVVQLAGQSTGARPAAHRRPLPPSARPAGILQPPPAGVAGQQPVVERRRRRLQQHLAVPPSALAGPQPHLPAPSDARLLADAHLRDAGLRPHAVALQHQQRHHARRLAPRRLRHHSAAAARPQLVECADADAGRRGDGGHLGRIQSGARLR